MHAVIVPETRAATIPSTPANTEIHQAIAAAVADCPAILAAKAYGSSLYRENTVDFDTAVLVPSSFGVVPEGVYIRLKRLRDELTYSLNIDFDLVPHTADEFKDRASPLWNPRYNPSLLHGRDIKGSFKVKDFTSHYRELSNIEMACVVLHDNRTITRRQLLRTLEGECGRIFVSKLLHGPGNALTVLACRNKKPPSVISSDMRGSLEEFDKGYGCDSFPIKHFLERCRKTLSYRMALHLMHWHESLFRVVCDPSESSVSYYNYCCRSIGLTA
jgi:hypothetical protein